MYVQDDLEKMTANQVNLSPRHFYTEGCHRNGLAYVRCRSCHVGPTGELNRYPSAAAEQAGLDLGQRQQRLSLVGFRAGTRKV